MEEPQGPRDHLGRANSPPPWAAARVEPPELRGPSCPEDQCRPMGPRRLG